jgi:protein subunit release factor A
MTELHLKRKDLEIEWLDEAALGTSPPGCRVTHIATGVKAESAIFRDRHENRRNALYVLSARLLLLGADRVVVEDHGAELIVVG